MARAWVLSIDADERVPEALAREIREAIASGRHDGYRLNRKAYFLGRFLSHGGWYPDRIVRLARRDHARFSADVVHESLEVSGSIGDLKNDMLHMTYRTIDDVLAKQRRYAMLSAQVRRERGARGGLGIALWRSHAAFLKHYIVQAGFLDGGRGLVAAISNRRRHSGATLPRAGSAQSEACDRPQTLCPLRGAERFIQTTAAALARQGVKVNIVSEQWQGAGDSLLEHVTVPSRGLTRHSALQNFQRNVAIIVGRENFDWCRRMSVC